MEQLSLKAKKIKTHNLRKVLPLYSKNKGLLILLMVFMVVGGVLGILQPITAANALANLATGEFDLAIKFVILNCILGLSRVILNAIIEALYLRIDSRTKMILTNKVICSINSTKMSVLDSTKLGALAERLSSDVNSVSSSFLDMMNLIFDILTNVVFLGYIAYLNIYLFLILLGYVVILYVVCTIRSRVWIRGRKITKKANDEAKSAYYEQVSGIRDVKLLNIKNNVTNFSNEKYNEALKLEVKIGDKRNLMRRVQGSLSIIFDLVFLILGIVFINKGMLLIAGLLVIYNYYGKVEGLVNFVSQFKEFKAEGEISASRIFEVIEDYKKEEFGTEELENFSGNIILKNVCFSYSTGTEILKNININFKPNTMTAIVGKSGSGKTTILNILSKLYDVDSGEVLLDGKNISTLTENSIRENIGEISQAPYIFNTTIRQNMLFAKPEASEDEIIEALKKAEIYDDIMAMENGLNTEIGENGVKLSGGQKQRLAIARLFLKNPKVIVFDEATSALDNESQKKIVEILETYKQSKTIIIVAHRLSTIVGADEIFMLGGGEIIASGSHRQLMKSCEEYEKLYRLEEVNSKLIDEENA